MGRLCSIVLFVLACTLTYAQKMTVMSYNLHHCEGMDKKLDEARIADIISANHPDVIAVQELDSVTVRCKSYQMKVLGEKTGMHYTYAKAIDFGGGKYGVGILSKEKPLCVRRVPLPGKEPRVLLICEFKKFYFACTHLCLHAENRMKSLPLIMEQAHLADKPFLIAGDWNAKPHEDFIVKMSEHFNFISDRTKYTFPSKEPRVCIDYIAVYKNSLKKRVKMKGYEVLDEKIASDHRPIKAVIKL